MIQKSCEVYHGKRDTSPHAIVTEQPHLPSVKITVYLRPKLRLRNSPYVLKNNRLLRVCARELSWKLHKLQETFNIGKQAGVNTLKWRLHGARTLRKLGFKLWKFADSFVPAPVCCTSKQVSGTYRTVLPARRRKPSQSKQDFMN